MSCELIKDGEISAIVCGVNKNNLGDKVEAPEDIKFDKSTNLTIIYNDKIINIPWKSNSVEEVLSLFDIENFIKELSKLLKGECPNIITVLASEPLTGTVYEYGNYGDYWVVCGKLLGYA